MLLNSLYKGELIWGKTESHKDHETGTRKRYRRPESEWIRRSDPALMIVDPSEWERAQTTRKMRSRWKQRDSAGIELSAINRAAGKLQRTSLQDGSSATTVALHSMLSIATPGAVVTVTIAESRIVKTAFESHNESWRIASWGDSNESS
jgi:hypothetical protein